MEFVVFVFPMLPCAFSPTHPLRMLQILITLGSERGNVHKSSREIKTFFLDGGVRYVVALYVSISGVIKTRIPTRNCRTNIAQQQTFIECVQWGQGCSSALTWVVFRCFAISLGVRGVSRSSRLLNFPSISLWSASSLPCSLFHLVSFSLLVFSLYRAWRLLGCQPG